jgi:hypothetical protein
MSIPRPGRPATSRPVSTDDRSGERKDVMSDAVRRTSRVDGTRRAGPALRVR